MALEAVTLTLISFLVLSMTAAEAIMLCLLYVSVLVLTRSIFQQTTQIIKIESPRTGNMAREMPGGGTPQQPLLSGAVRERWYAVARGLRPGIYTTWDECAQQVVGVRGAIHKSFPTREQAEDFIRRRR